MEKENMNKNDDSIEEDINLDKASYTYWKRESDQPFSNDFKPTKSDPVLTSNASTESQQFGSAWNKAGTWEERHLTKNQIEEFFRNSLKNKPAFADTFSLDKITSYTGDTYYVFVRGKIKFVYDCEFTLSINGVRDFEEVTGEIKLREVSNHTLDDDFEFDYSEQLKGDSEKARIVLSQFKKNQEKVQQILKEVFEEIKESCIKTGNI